MLSERVPDTVLITLEADLKMNTMQNTVPGSPASGEEARLISKSHQGWDHDSNVTVVICPRPKGNLEAGREYRRAYLYHIKE
jgi:hypothetical protein